MPELPSCLYCTTAGLNMCVLQLELAGADVSVQLRRDRHEVTARPEVERVLNHVRVETLLLVLEFFQLERAWNLK